jgi:hypothetical protein
MPPSATLSTAEIVGLLTLGVLGLGLLLAAGYRLGRDP